MRLSVKYFLFFLILMILSPSETMLAQGGYYGFQISPGFSTQKWNNSSRQALLTINADAFMSMYGVNESNIYYAKVGYHQRGSTTTFSNFPGSRNSQLKYVFHNAVVSAGVKKMLIDKFDLPFYYLLGLRLEYTILTNFKDINAANSFYYPQDYFVNRFNYGVDFGAGFVYDFLPNYDIFLELMVSPDYSLQYEQVPISNVPLPYNPSETVNIGERLVRNLSFELSLGIRMNQ